MPPLQVVPDGQATLDEALEEMIILCSLKSLKMTIEDSGVSELVPFFNRLDRMIAERDA